MKPRISFAIPRQLLWPTRVFVLTMLLLSLGLLVHPLGDPDVYIHLRDGRHWVEHKLHVDKEPFAYTVPDKSIERVEVLFRIGIYLAYRVGGYSLLTILKALAMTLALGILGLLIYRRWRNLGVVAFLLALAMLAPMNRIMPERPYVVTYVLLPLFLLLLDQYRQAGPNEERSVRNRLWFLPLTAIFWANCHPGFIVIFGFLGAQVLEDLFLWWRTQDPLPRQRVQWLSLIAVATFVAGALNPIGFSIYSFVLDTTSSRDFMKFLTEWAPPTMEHEPLFFVALALVWTAQLFAIRRSRLHAILPTAVFSYLAIKSYRNMPLFLIAALPPLADHLHYLKNKYLPALNLSLAGRKYGLWLGSSLLTGVLAWASVTGYAFRLGEIKGMYPEHGLAWLMEHPINGRVLTHDIWGGYTGWMTQGRLQVFIDGRFPLFGEKLYADYRKMIWGDPQYCLPLLDKYNIQGLLISPKNDIKLYQQLWKSRNWTLIYWDDVCSLYVRNSPEHRALIESFQYRAINPKRSPYYNPAKREDALQEAKRAAEISPDSFLPWFFVGELSLQLNVREQARKAFAKVLQLAPRHTATLYNLGVMAQQDKKYETAENYFRASLKNKSSAMIEGRTCYMLATTILHNPKRRAEALHWAKEAVKALPTWEPAKQLVRELSP